VIVVYFNLYDFIEYRLYSINFTSKANHAI